MTTLTYGLEDVIAALQATGLSRGDTVFLSTSLGMFGIAQDVHCSDALNALFFRAIKTVLGPEGTMLAPGYSYTFGKSRLHHPAVFDLQATPAETGPFPDFIRRQSLASRSADPMVSVVGMGPLCAELFHDLPNNSYGRNCLFQRLLDYPVKCCNLGLGANWMAFIHHVDWRYQVPFRFDKVFHGIIDDGICRQETDWIYSVPLLQPQAVANAHAVARQSEAAGLWQVAKLARNQIYTVDYRRYFDFVNPLVKHNPWLLATGPAMDVLQAERTRAKETPLRYSLVLDDVYLFVAAIAGRIRAAASDHVDAVLLSLQQQLPIRIQYFASGENLAGHVVPEKWRVVNFSIRDAQQNDWTHRFLVNHYSLSLNEKLSGQALQALCNCCDDRPNAVPEIVYDHRRTTGLACSQRTRADLKAEDHYQVMLETCFYAGQLSVGVFEYTQPAAKKMVICGYLGGTYAVTDKLTGAYLACQLIAGISAQLIRPACSVTILLVPNDQAVAYWLSQQSSADIASIQLVLSVRGVGGHGRLQCFNNAAADAFLAPFPALVQGRKPLQNSRFSPVQIGEMVDDCAAHLTSINQLSQAVLSHADLSLDMPFAEYATDLDNGERVVQDKIDQAYAMLVALLEGPGQPERA